ncbi:hypothetical protein F2Q70_00021925 [Brassica cretica]|uniref:Uncharacterized protein n=1 Tax=Brassica cretica TaxID=69181 RepID=A0A8S9GKV6_BRACR|nr:hypothetical protein F2Q70_00021925 [Brassica cretica]
MTSLWSAAAISGTILRTDGLTTNCRIKELAGSLTRTGSSKSCGRDIFSVPKPKSSISALRHPASLVGAVRVGDPVMRLLACLCGSSLSSINLAPVPFALMVETVLCGALFLLWNGSGLGKGFSPIPWLSASLNLSDDGFSSINYKGGIGLASAPYALHSEGVVLLGERWFCHYFQILMEQRLSKFKIGGIDLLDTDLQLVSSQAATVDNRRTKLFENMYLSIRMVLLRALLSALCGFIATYLIWRLESPLASNPLSEQRLSMESP